MPLSVTTLVEAAPEPLKCSVFELYVGVLAVLISAFEVLVDAAPVSDKLVLAVDVSVEADWAVTVSSPIADEDRRARGDFSESV